MAPPSACAATPRDDCSVSPLIGGLAHVGFEHVEACSKQLGAEVVDRPLVRRSDRVSELLHRGSLEEADEQRASWFEHAPELPQGGLNRLRLVVDEGVPGENPIDRVRFGIEGSEITDREAYGGVRVPGVRDALRYKVDSADNVTLLGKEVRPVAWSASSVDGLVDAGCPGGDELAIRWTHGVHQPKTFDVLRCAQ